LAVVAVEEVMVEEEEEEGGRMVEQLMEMVIASMWTAVGVSFAHLGGSLQS
jgi:hypothetical protein